MSLQLKKKKNEEKVAYLATSDYGAMWHGTVWYDALDSAQHISGQTDATLQTEINRWSSQDPVAETLVSLLTPAPSHLGL